MTFTRFRGMISDFRSDDSFPVKTGSRPTAIVHPGSLSRHDIPESPEDCGCLRTVRPQFPG